MGMISRIKNRRKARQENVRLGGSAAEEQRLNDAAEHNAGWSRTNSIESRQRLQSEAGEARGAADRAAKEYRDDRRTARDSAKTRDASIGDINSAADKGSNLFGAAGTQAASEYTSGARQGIDTRNNALASGSLVGSTDNVLGQRRSALAGSPTIGQATESAITANAQNAAAQQARSSEMLQRQAMGLAASQGEGGALAMQQALASAGAGAADMAGQQNLALADQNAQLRYAAAMGQRQEDVDLANSDASSRLAAQQAERANQLNIAGANAQSLEGAAAARAGLGMDVAAARAAAKYQGALATADARANAANADAATRNSSSQREMGYAQQAGTLAAGASELDNAKLASDQNYQKDLLTAKFASGQAVNAETPKWGGGILGMGILGRK